MQPHILFGLIFVIITFVCLANSKAIPTDVCSVTDLADLVELENKVNYERIACEGDKFLGYQCSRYWMLNNDLTRRKLSFEKCLARKRAAFLSWAGTRTVNGEFQNDHAETISELQRQFSELQALISNLHNSTLTLFINETTETKVQLVANENTQAESERLNTATEATATRNVVSSELLQTRTWESAQAQAERTLVRAEETSNRDTVQLDGLTSRTKAIDEFTSTQNVVNAESQATQHHDTAEELATRSHATLQADALRTLDSQQEHEHRALQTQEEQTTRSFTSAQEQTTRDTDTQEETETRTEVQQQETQTRNANTAQEDATRTENSAQELSVRAHSAEREDAVRNASSADAQSSSDLFTGEARLFPGSIAATVTSQESTTRTLVVSTEIDITANVNAVQTQVRAAIVGVDSNTQDVITSESNGVAAYKPASDVNIFAALAGFQAQIPKDVYRSITMQRNLLLSSKKNRPAVDLYSRSGDDFNAMRALVNETISYNKRYRATPYSQKADDFWDAGEVFRLAGKLRSAVWRYSEAYIYAVTPYLDNP